MMRKQLPVALTIAGSDSGGGAGLQADLKTFAALGVHGASVVTCLTAQNPRAILDLRPVPPPLVRRQLEAVYAELPPAAVKTGLLFSREIIQVVAGHLRQNRGTPLVVDPLMSSGRGTPLLQHTAACTLRESLLPLATLVTPNLAEAAILAEQRLASVEDLRRAAREIHRRFGVAVLAKGGHLRGYQEAVDIFYDGHQELLLSAPFLRGGRTHGTGCTYSAAITAHLARGQSLPQAVTNAKQYITRAIAGSCGIGKHTVLGWEMGGRLE